MNTPSDARGLARVAAGLVFLAASAVAPPSRADEPPRSEPQAPEDDERAQREEFARGMDRYRAGELEAAILIWSKVYRELGVARGYRVAFNLGRAYDQVDDPLHAAEHYEDYLAAVRRRREASEPLEEIVAKQEAEAEGRMQALRAELGRIRLRRPAVAVVIDAVPIVDRSVTFVLPGRHTVVFPPDPRRTEILVGAGQIVDVEPPASEPASPPPPAPAPLRWELRVQRPYPATLVYIGAGLTAVSLLAPAALYSQASSHESDYAIANGRDDAAAERARERYENARSTAYTSWAIPVLFAGATIALAAYWFLGAKTVRTPMQVGLAF